MRSLRTLLAVAGLVAIVPALARAEGAAATPEYLLSTFKPNLKGVDYETPTGKAVEECKVETVYSAEKKAIGWALRDGQGKLLRKFLDTRGSRDLDQWSYYLDGFEVYREVDTNDDKRLDECRWMNAGGTRIAKVQLVEVKEKVWNLRVVEWKKITAEEASKVFVQAIISRDLGLLETVLATPEELKSLGLPESVVKRAAEGHAKRTAQVNSLVQGLTGSGWTTSTVWNRLDATMPHLIPAGAETGLKEDLILLENAVVLAGAPASGQAALSDLAFLQVPEIVKIGDTWKFVELPRAVDPKNPILASEGGIRSEIFGKVLLGGAGGARSPELDAALAKLADFDAKQGGAVAPREIAEFHRGRILLLRDVLKHVKDPQEQLAFEKQIVDSLAAAYQVGLYPKGLELLDMFVKKGDKIGSYAAFRRISADFALKNNEGGNVMANQKEWMGNLVGFYTKYPKAEEAPDALLQLASANEYNAEEDEAKKYYEQLVADFPGTDSGKKAAGALKRLDLVGKPLVLKGPNLRNEPIDLSQYRGKTVLVTFWASWAEPFKRELPQLLKLAEKHQSQGFEIVGVCLDPEPKELELFLKENPLPWPQIFIAGGLEKNPLAFDFGIIALPTMILVDSQGKVVNRNIRSASELERQLEKALAGRGAGVALSPK